MARRRIPVIVVAGFLGAGKTTLLNHLLTHSGSTRVGVIVNDFGAINIDSMTVAGQVDAMVSLDNGCLCCAVDASGLDHMLKRLCRPSSDLDVVVVESSGLADPRGMVRLLLSSDDPHITYGGLVLVVDAAEFDATRARHPEIATHLDFADLVLLNKTDRVTAEELAALTGTLDELGPGTPLLVTDHGRIDPGILFEQRPHAPPPVGTQLSFDDLRRAEDEDQPTKHHPTKHQPEPEHLHGGYESIEFVDSRPFGPREFMAFLDDRPSGLYRMKGHVHFDVAEHRQKFVVHAVGNYLRFRRQRWATGEQRGTQLVAIGSDIDARALRDRLASCVRTESVEDEYAMLPVLKFTED